MLLDKILDLTPEDLARPDDPRTDWSGFRKVSRSGHILDRRQGLGDVAIGRQLGAED